MVMLNKAVAVQKDKRWIPEWDGYMLLNDVDYAIGVLINDSGSAMDIFEAVSGWTEDHSRFTHNNAAWVILSEVVADWDAVDPLKLWDAFQVPAGEIAAIAKSFPHEESDFPRFAEISLLFRGLLWAARMKCHRALGLGLDMDMKLQCQAALAPHRASNQ